MKNQDSVLQVENNSGLLYLTLNRPDSANALSPELTEALIQALAEAENIHLCVIKGEGRHFCAGFDLGNLEELSDGDLLWRFLRIETLLQSIHHAPFPVIALAQGQAIGAGADLFVACWQRVVAPDFKLRMPGWNFELALGTRRLTRLIGTDAARNLFIDSKILSAEESLACRLASEIADIENWSSIVDSLGRRCATLSAGALQNMLELTIEDSRCDDIAAIVKTAGRPGLKQRIMRYRDSLTSRKKA